MQLLFLGSAGVLTATTNYWWLFGNRVQQCRVASRCSIRRPKIDHEWFSHERLRWWSSCNIVDFGWTTCTPRAWLASAFCINLLNSAWPCKARLGEALHATWCGPCFHQGSTGDEIFVTFFWQLLLTWGRSARQSEKHTRQHMAKTLFLNMGVRVHLDE